MQASVAYNLLSFSYIYVSNSKTNKKNSFLLFFTSHWFLWHLQTSHTVDSSMHFSNMLIQCVKTLDQGPNGSNKHWSTPFWMNFNKDILNDSLVIHWTCIFIVLESQITSEGHGVRWMTLHLFVFIVCVCIWFLRFDTKVMVCSYDFEVVVPKVIFQKQLCLIFKKG